MSGDAEFVDEGCASDGAATILFLPDGEAGYSACVALPCSCYAAFDERKTECQHALARPVEVIRTGRVHSTFTPTTPRPRTPRSCRLVEVLKAPD